MMKKMPESDWEIIISEAEDGQRDAKIFLESTNENN